MKKQRVIQAICDCRDPRDGKAGIADICRALGKAADRDELDRLEETLRKEYNGYVDVVTDGGCVRVKPRALAENARNERGAGEAEPATSGPWFRGAAARPAQQSLT